MRFLRTILTEFCMAAAQLMLPANRAFNSNGIGAPRAVAYLYTTGTTTPQPFYSDSGLSVSLGSSITANGAGRFPTAYQDTATAFRLRIEDADGAELEDIDPFYFGQTTVTVNSLFVTPEQYGAVGDGTTNDYAAIQAAIDAVEAAGGGTVKFSANTYLCNSQLTWDGAPIQLLGDGAGIQPTGGTILLFPIGLSGAVNPKNGSGGLGAGSAIRNLRVMGSASTATVTITIASPGIVTWTAHGFVADTPVIFSTTGALPTGLSAGTVYFVRNPTTNTFELSATAGGASINTSGSQSGTHSGARTVTDANAVLGVGCGIKLQANSAHVEGVVVQGFEGNGLYVLSGVGGADVSINANNCVIDKLQCYANHRNGFASYGVDSNAVTITKLDASNNYQFGAYENGALGNVYVNPHFSGNGVGPIRFGGSTINNRVYGAYKEVGTALLVQFDAGGGGKNIVDFASAEATVGAPSTFTITDNTVSLDNDVTVLGVRRKARFGGTDAIGKVTIDDSALTLYDSFPILLKDNPLTANWFLKNSSGKPTFEKGGAAYLTVNDDGFGYGGANGGTGGSVTQATSRTTGVTINNVCGKITLVSAAGSATYQSFTVTNSKVAANDTIRVCQQSGTDLYEIHVTAVAAGSFRITYRTTGGTTVEQPVFNFSIVKGVVN